MYNSQIQCALFGIITEDAKITTDQCELLFCGRVFFKQVDHESMLLLLLPGNVFGFSVMNISTVNL